MPTPRSLFRSVPLSFSSCSRLSARKSASASDCSCSLQLLQVKIGDDHADPVLHQGDAHGYPGVCHHLQALGPASAGGLQLSGIAYETFPHQLGEALVDGGQAEVQPFRQLRLGAAIL